MPNASGRPCSGLGAPLARLTIEDLKTPDVVFQIGVAPRRIDILTSIAGVEFDEPWLHRKIIELEGLMFAERVTCGVGGSGRQIGYRACRVGPRLAGRRRAPRRVSRHF